MEGAEDLNQFNVITNRLKGRRLLLPIDFLIHGTFSIAWHFDLFFWKRGVPRTPHSYTQQTRIHSRSFRDPSQEPLTHGSLLIWTREMLCKYANEACANKGWRTPSQKVDCWITTTGKDIRWICGRESGAPLVFSSKGARSCPRPIRSRTSAQALLSHPKQTKEAPQELSPFCCIFPSRNPEAPLALISPASHNLIPNSRKIHILWNPRNNPKRTYSWWSFVLTSW